jgi:hypothetical protein
LPTVLPRGPGTQERVHPSPCRPSLVVLLPRGEAIRNFVYSGMLDELERLATLNILSVMPNDAFKEMLSARFLHVHPLHDVRERWAPRFLRQFLDTAHGRWLWSMAARERWRLRDLEAASPGEKFKRGFKKLACFPFANRLGLSLLAAAEGAASRQWRATDHYLRFFRQHRPALVFNGSHVHSQLATQAVHAAQALGLPTATFIFSWDNLTSQGRIIPLYDYYIVWNEGIRDQLLDIYKAIRPEQVFVTGTPQFDFHFDAQYYWSREEFCRRVGADPARPIVLYSTGMANHIAGEPRLVEDIANQLRSMNEFGPPQLLVRIYAKGPQGIFEELKRRRPDILFPEILWEPEWLTPKIEDLYLLTNMLRHCAVGLNVASTISLELCMFDKPCINIGYLPPGVPMVFDYRRYYEFEHYKPIVDSGAIQVARSETEMSSMLHQALSHPGRDSAQRRLLLQRFFGPTLDGQSGRRVARQLYQLALAGA